jgi:hypothetical protein
MGTEYTIRSERAVDPQRLESLLRSLPLFAGFEPTFATYDFREPDNPGRMPNVSVKLEADGSVYVCDYGGARLASAIIGAVMIHAVHETSARVELRLIE